MTQPQVKDLIEKVCLNDNCSKSKRLVKIETVDTPKGMFVVDTHIALLAQIELLNKNIDERSLSKANVIQIQALRCDFCGGEHAIGMCSLEGQSEEVQFVNFQKNNPYSNTYNPGWKHHPNFCWSNNQDSSANQGMQHGHRALIQSKPS